MKDDETVSSWVVVQNNALPSVLIPVWAISFLSKKRKGVPGTQKCLDAHGKPEN